MKRLCFLSPDIDHARQVIADLKAAGIPEKHIYTLARYGTDMQDLPDAGPESDDFLAAYERHGWPVCRPGRTGLPAGRPDTRWRFCAAAGPVWRRRQRHAHRHCRRSLFQPRLQEFEQAIEQGRILVMVDVARDEVEKYQALVRKQDPDIRVEGIEPEPQLIP